MSFKQLLHNLFLPSETNNYRAKLLHIRSLTYYLLTIFLFILIYRVSVLGNTVNGSVMGVATDITQEKLFIATNEERVKNGLPPLNYNKKLEKAAYEKAKDMFYHHYWSHYGPDGATPWDFVLGVGYQYQYAGENLARDFMFSEAVVKAWMASASHRENILRSVYTDIGLAVVNGNLDGNPTTLVVQMFGAPWETAKTNNVLSIGTVKTNYPFPGAIKKISYQVSLGFLIFLLLVLAADLYWAYKLRLIRIGGKHIAHGIFLVIVVIAFMIAAKGIIL